RTRKPKRRRWPRKLRRRLRICCATPSSPTLTAGFLSRPTAAASTGRPRAATSASAKRTSSIRFAGIASVTACIAFICGEINVIEVPLTQGKVALVDDGDAERVLAHKWTALWHPRSKRWYARRNIWENGKQHIMYLHRFILNAPRDRQVDHINRDSLDNR